MRSNQLRLLFSTMAYLLHHVLREFGLTGTEMQNAQACPIRIRISDGSNAFWTTSAVSVRTRCR